MRKGVPDLVILHSGRTFGRETKTLTGTLSREHKEFRVEWELAGGTSSLSKREERCWKSGEWLGQMDGDVGPAWGRPCFWVRPAAAPIRLANEWRVNVDSLTARVDLRALGACAPIPRFAEFFAERAHQRFRSDPELRELIMAAQARAEAEEMEEWRALPAGADRGGGGR
jgi:hypothetical protein